MPPELLAFLVPATAGLIMAGGGYALNKMRRVGNDELILGNKEVGAGLLFGITFIGVVVWAAISPPENGDRTWVLLWLVMSGGAVAYVFTAWARVRLLVDKQGFVYRDIRRREFSARWSDVECLDVRWYTRRLEVRLTDGSRVLITPAIGGLERLFVAAEEARLPLSPRLQKTRARMAKRGDGEFTGA